MFYGHDRDRIRHIYCQAWNKHRSGAALEPLERMIVDTVLEHPEYHALLEDAEQAAASEFHPEVAQTNPFLHMGMHIAIQEQLSSGNPPGLRDAYRRLLERLQDRHDVEHRIMHCLAEVLWQAQRAGRDPDEHAYLECLHRL